MAVVLPPSNPRLNGELAMLRSGARTRDPIQSTPYVPSDPNAAGSAFAAGLWRENIVASLWHEITDGDERRTDQEVANYNPFTRLKAMYDKDTLDKIAANVSEGDLDQVYSDAQLKATVEDILWERDMDEKSMADPTAYFMGGILGGFLDPTSYIPMVGVAGRATRLGKAGMVALNTMLQTTASESVLQLTQRERSLDDTLMNIGVSAALGGGIGLFAAGLHPKHVMHPDHADNPLRPENIAKEGETVRTLDGKVDAITADELARNAEDIVAYSPAGAGAEAALRDIPALARAEPKTAVGKAVRKFGDWFNSQTITGQLIRANAPAARWVGAMLTDTSALILKQNLKGVATAAGADAINNWRNVEFQRLWDGMTAQIRKLNGEVNGKKVDPTDIFSLTQRAVIGMEDEELNSLLRGKYGPDFDKVKAKADEFAETVHQMNQRQEDELIAFGMVRDNAKVTRLTAELEALRETARTANAIGEFDGQLSAKEIKQLRKDRDAKKAELRAELEKPEALGRDYGHAQLWNREMVLANPDQFKAMLMEVLAFEPDPVWLADHHGITKEQFAELPVEAPEGELSQRSVRNEWVEDEHYWRIERAELLAKAAEENAKQARLDMGELLRKLGLAKRDEVQIDLSVARKKRDALNAELASNKAQREQIEREQRAFIEAAQAARMAGSDRAARELAGEQTQLEITRDQRAARVGAAADEAERKLMDALTDPATPVDEFGNSRATDAGDVADAQRAADAAPGRLDVAEAKVRQDMDNVRVVTARQQGKAREAQHKLTTLAREARELEAKATELNAKLTDLESLQEAVTTARRNLTEAVSDARKVRGISETNLRKVKKQLRKETNRLSLSRLVDDIYENIARSGSTPQAILDRLAEESDRTTGRVKQRSIRLSPEQRLAAQKAGFLRDDLPSILRAQSEQVNAELAIAEALDIRPGGRFQSWGEVQKHVEGEYDDLIAAAPADQKGRLIAEKERSWKNIVAARDRLKGGVYQDDGTASGVIRYSVKKMGQANFIRFGSGFLVSSQTDMATFALRHGAPGKAILRYANQTIKLMTKMAEEDPTHFMAFARATEIGAGVAATAKRFGTENPLHGQLWGYGIGYGTTRKVTAAIDKAAERIGTFGINLGGLPVHNTFWKITAALAMRDRLADVVGRFSKLSAAEQADLASFGIGRAEAERMAPFLEKYGTRDEDGIFDPNLEDWDGPEGMSAARDFELTIMRDMNRAVNTPTVGDTPRWMDHLAGDFFGTFQTFAFTFQNQFAYPMAQRIALFKDRQAMASLGYLVAASLAVVIAKDIQNGRDPSQRFTPEKFGDTMYEVVDRSGMMGFMSPYVDSALKLTSGYTGFAGGQRYARNDWIGSMLGINYALLSDVQKVGVALASPEVSLEDKLSKAATIAPYKAQFQLLGRFLPTE